MAEYSYNVDLCMVIDKTGSMKPVMDTVKDNALNMYDDIKGALEVKGKHIGRFRIRLILFGDYSSDENPMLMTPFMIMPDEKATLERAIRGLQPRGGGDIPEDGLEALAFAMRSDWCKDSEKARHIIALFTDAVPHEIGYNKAAAKYPREWMPANFAELMLRWGVPGQPGEMNPSAKRLLLFAPDAEKWHTIADSWSETVIRDVAMGTGLQDVGYEAILDTIANSV